MKIAGKSLFARFIGTPFILLVLCLTLFYAASMGLYLNSAQAAQPTQPAMMDCHDMDMPQSQQPDAPDTSCCNTVGCCPVVSPMAFTPIARQFSQPVQLTEWAPSLAVLDLIRRLDRPPRA